MRKSKEELQKIQDKYGVSRIWSWSRLNCFHTSPYEYYLKYVAFTKEDRADCIYATTGGMTHSIIERLYSGKIAYEDMDAEFEDAWLTACIAELKFDRNDSEKNKKIADKYYKDLKHFFNNHNMLPKKVQLEQFITVMVGGNLFQGYIDACFKDDNGCYNILDWKTSSIYKGEKALNECGQLVLYAMGLHQIGVPYEKIKICWDFVKYVKVDYLQANGKWKSREIERYDIGNKLQNIAKMWLNKLGYQDKFMEYLDALAQSGDINCLPEDVRAKFKISDCIVYVNITDDLIIRWKKYIIDTIADISKKEASYKSSYDESVFYDDPEHVKSESYYFATLCGYSPKLHKPYKKYLDELEAQKNGSSLFNNVGTQASDDDLSWLDEL